MKNFLFLLIFSAFFSTTVQSQSIPGNYVGRWVSVNGEILEQTLELSADSTFTFHYYQTFLSPNPEKHIYGKGTWNLDNTIVTFYADKKNDLDAVHTLNFNNSKARFISKSPRDKSDREVKTAVRFYESEIPWAKSMLLFKIE